MEMLITWLALASPVVCIVGLAVGIWACRTNLAPRLGIADIVAASILPISFAGLVILNNTRSHADPDIDALGVVMIGEFICAPLALIVTTLIIATLIVGNKKRSANHAMKGIS